MNRAGRRKQAKLNKKTGKTKGNQFSGLDTLVVGENDGRKIVAHYQENTAEGFLTTDLALCLHHTLEHFGDISGVDGQAMVKLTTEKGLPVIKVNQDCFFEGNYNGFSGKMTAKTCEFALGITLSCHWANAHKEYPEFAKRFYQHYHELRDKAFLSLSDAEQSELWKFLD